MYKPYNTEVADNNCVTANTSLQTMLLELVALTFRKHAKTSVLLSTYPDSQVIDVGIWDHSTGEPELQETQSICFESSDAETQIDKLINRVRDFYGEQAA